MQNNHNDDEVPKEWQDAINKVVKSIQLDVDRRIMWEMLYNDDMVRPLPDEEISKRFLRVGGDAICQYCEQRYEDHPNETRVLSYDGYPFLKRLCDGTLGKT